MSKKSATPQTTTLKPTQIRSALRHNMMTDIATFVWGPPGIAKSAVAKALATEMGIAFVDVRLSQMDPTDLRGIPMPTKIGGVAGVQWSAPLVLPRDLFFNELITIEEGVNTIAFYNPIGVNDIPYCVDPQITLTPAEKGCVAEIVARGPDFIEVRLRPLGADGKPTPATQQNGEEFVETVAGKVRVRISGKVKALVGLEEFNSAPPSVQAAAYQLILDRRLGEYVVPKGVKLIAMGNRETDKGVTYRLPTPILNRFVHLEMRSDFEDWQWWAVENFVHPDVVGYITAFKNELDQFEPSSAARGFPTPRSWHFVSELLKVKENTSENVLAADVMGAVGEAAGAKFMEFRKMTTDLPNPADVLSGAVRKLPKPVGVALAYALATTLCYEMKIKIDDLVRKYGDLDKVRKSKDYTDWLVFGDNFIRFLMENFQPEIAIMGCKSALQIHKLPFDMRQMPRFKEFTNEYKDLIMQRDVD